MNKIHKHGLAVMRLQPLHKGHIITIDKMLNECEVVTIVIGSAQESRTANNPFTADERKQMLMNYYQDKEEFIITPLADINNWDKWSIHVLIHTFLMDCHVDAYYAGSEEDADVFRNQKNLKIIIVDRFASDSPKCSGTQIRSLLLNKDESWKKYIPECNWKIVEEVYNAR